MASRELNSEWFADDRATSPSRPVSWSDTVCSVAIFFPMVVLVPFACAMWFPMPLFEPTPNHTVVVDVHALGECSATLETLWVSIAASSAAAMCIFVHLSMARLCPPSPQRDGARVWCATIIASTAFVAFSVACYVAAAAAAYRAPTSVMAGNVLSCTVAHEPSQLYVDCTHFVGQRQSALATDALVRPTYGHPPSDRDRVRPVRCPPFQPYTCYEPSVAVACRYVNLRQTATTPRPPTNETYVPPAIETHAGLDDLWYVFLIMILCAVPILMFALSLSVHCCTLPAL